MKSLDSKRVVLGSLFAPLQFYQIYQNKHSIYELVDSIKNPPLEWVINNSHDLRVEKNHHSHSPLYCSLVAYVEPIHYTYWKLKFPSLVINEGLV